MQVVRGLLDHRLALVEEVPDSLLVGADDVDSQASRDDLGHPRERGGDEGPEPGEGTAGGGRRVGVWWGSGVVWGEEAGGNGGGKGPGLAAARGRCGIALPRGCARTSQRPCYPRPTSRRRQSWRRAARPGPALAPIEGRGRTGEHPPAAPHAAMAIGTAFLIAPSGWIARILRPWATGWTLPPDLATVQDRLGVALILGLMPILPKHATNAETFARSTLKPPTGCHSGMG